MSFSIIPTDPPPSYQQTLKNDAALRRLQSNNPLSTAQCRQPRSGFLPPSLARAGSRPTWRPELSFLPFRSVHPTFYLFVCFPHFFPIALARRISNGGTRYEPLLVLSGR